MAYGSPEWVEAGSIDLNPSQNGSLGIVVPVPDDFANWILKEGAGKNLKSNLAYDAATKSIVAISGKVPDDFNPYDRLTWHWVLE